MITYLLCACARVHSHNTHTTIRRWNRRTPIAPDPNGLERFTILSPQEATAAVVAPVTAVVTNPMAGTQPIIQAVTRMQTQAIQPAELRQGDSAIEA